MPAGCNRLWWALAFVPLLMSLITPMTKMDIINTQVLQEEKIFLVISISEWSAQWSLKYMYVHKCSEIWMKNSEQNFLRRHFKLLHGKNCPSHRCLLRNFWAESKPNRRSITAAKRLERKKKESQKKKKEKTQKPKDVGHYLVQKLENYFDLCACLGKNVTKRDGSTKKGMLSCCKCLFG